MTFNGFSKPNTVPVPIELFDDVLADIDTLAKLKVTLKVVQRTLGYGKALDWIALDQFETGIVTTKRGRVPERTQIDRGVGLSRSAIRDGLEGAVANGYLLKRIVCPNCSQAVEQQPMVRQRVHRGQAQTYTELSVSNICPHCHTPLKGRERVFYGLRWATAPEKGVATCYPVSKKGVASSYLLSPGGDHNAGNGVASCYPQNITLSVKPAGAGWADAPHAASASNSLPPDPAFDHAVDQLTSETAGNRLDAHRVETASGASPQRNSDAGRLEQIQALLDHNLKAALAALVDELGVRFGLTLAGLRAAQLCLVPLPERRRRTLDDMRRMQGRTDLAEHERKRKVRAIITQNIGVTIGLGVKPNGSLRTVAEKNDYSIIGGLVNEFGAEQVWLTACAIAGLAIEGDPIDYLRATLRNKREREKNASSSSLRQRGPSGLGSFDDIDYSKEEVGV